MLHVVHIYQIIFNPQKANNLQVISGFQVVVMMKTVMWIYGWENNFFDESSFVEEKLSEKLILFPEDFNLCWLF